ncbi:hypothetical protein JSY14_10300 [Brachybacterium sp. EF45031]|uniref:septum formation initiator family protein n=1 Tax=Brachybacterium sillae TaxID=2810536 RepID=UPI00217CD316|nr:septum formation initiator family protein [Brachybacterium sillae]MCS6712396.1 hypothetical protein [Brachybacterium sillae]
MVSITATARPLRSPRPASPASTRPRLTVVSRPRPRLSTVPFAILCTAILLASLLSVLVLNVQMSDTSYRITRLQAQSQRLAEEEQALVEQNRHLDTPQELEKRARALGMVPVGEPAYIDLATGEVVGGEGAAATDPAGVQAPPAPMPAVPGPGTPYRGLGGEGL